jgi:hypothetical protein
MSDRRRHRAHLPARLPALPPDEMAEVVRVFAAALQQVREVETERLRFTLHELELFRYGMAELIAELRENAAADAQQPLIK